MSRDKKYKEFIPKEDNTMSTIMAKDINELQDAINSLQRQSFNQSDSLFLGHCVNTLSNHPSANAMIVDLLEDTRYLNMKDMEEIMFDENTKSLMMVETYVDDDDLVERLTSTTMTEFIFNNTDKPIRMPIIKVDEYKPHGSDIKYEITYNGNDFYELKPNVQMQDTKHMVDMKFAIRITMTRLGTWDGPRLEAWALQFVDEKYKFRFLEDGLTYNVEALWDGTIVE